MRFLKSLAALLIAASLTFTTSAYGKGIGEPKGFENQVYHASLALYGTLPQGSEVDGHFVLQARTNFLCTVTAIKKVKGGYILLGAGHCTAKGNSELPSALEYSVAENIGEKLMSVQLLKAKLDEPKNIDFAVYYLKTDKELPVIEIGDESEVYVGSKTIDVNFSLGETLTKELSEGYVSSVVAEKGKLKGFYLVTQFDSHGASGSAVVSEETHKIIGLVVAGVDGTTTPTIVEPISVISAEVQTTQIPE